MTRVEREELDNQLAEIQSLIGEMEAVAIRLRQVSEAALVSASNVRQKVVTGDDSPA